MLRATWLRCAFVCVAMRVDRLAPTRDRRAEAEQRLGALGSGTHKCCRLPSGYRRDSGVQSGGLAGVTEHVHEPLRLLGAAH